MTAIKDRSNAMAFAAEGMASTAGAAALRSVRNLAASAPAGRLFAAISTLSDMSAKAASQLENGRLAAAIGTMDALATAATPEPREIPGYLRKQG